MCNTVVYHTNSETSCNILNVISILGDEILAVNGVVLHGLSHEEAIAIFKKIRAGTVVLQIGRRGAAVTQPPHPKIRSLNQNLNVKSGTNA